MEKAFCKGGLADFIQSYNYASRNKCHQGIVAVKEYLCCLSHPILYSLPVFWTDVNILFIPLTVLARILNPLAIEVASGEQSSIWLREL